MRLSHVAITHTTTAWLYREALDNISQPLPYFAQLMSMFAQHQPCCGGGIVLDTDSNYQEWQS